MMKALVFHGPFDVRLEDRKIPQILEPTDVIVKTTSAALCGSELHRYRGYSKTNMQPGYVCGHEGTGIVYKVGDAITKFSIGDQVIAPFLISCNECFNCKRNVHGRCSKGVNFGGPALDGSQAQYFRVPLADTTLYHLPQDADLGELAILMTDIMPTGYNGARRAFIDTPKEQWKDMTIAVIGCGPVAMCSIIAAREFRPSRIFAVDSNPSRLKTAEELGCITINFKERDPVTVIKEATNGNGCHAVIEGVGASAALRTAFDIVCPSGKISAFGLHNSDLPFTGNECYTKDLHIHFGRCPLRLVFDDALNVLIRNKELITKLKFVDVVLPALDESFKEALDKFERGEVNKVVFKPNGLDVRV